MFAFECWHKDYPERDKRRKEIDLLRQIHQVGRETHGM